MQRLKQKKGFTLVEMLVCILTLLMIMLICTTGMNMAFKSYHESLFESNSQMLESMLNTTLGDVLRYSENIVESNDSIMFRNVDFGVEQGQIKLDEAGKGYLVLATSDAEETLLLSTKVYVDGLFVEDFRLDYDADSKIFTGGYTIGSTIVSRKKEVLFKFKSILESV